MATHPSGILAWRILWVREPVGYSPQGLQRVETTDVHWRMPRAYHVLSSLKIKSCKPWPTEGDQIKGLNQFLSTFLWE